MKQMKTNADMDRYGPGVFKKTRYPRHWAYPGYNYIHIYISHEDPSGINGLIIPMEYENHIESYINHIESMV
jgi:hypothetical protein